MYDNEYSRTIISAAENVQTAVMGTLISAFILNLFIKGALAELFGAIRSL